MEFRYYSDRTRNTAAFMSKLPWTVETLDVPVNSPYTLIAPSYGKELLVPQPVQDFLDATDPALLVGVIGTGNLNFGTKYCSGADQISDRYNVPVLQRVDMRGSSDDVNTIVRGIELHGDTLMNMRRNQQVHDKGTWNTSL